MTVGKFAVTQTWTHNTAVSPREEGRWAAWTPLISQLSWNAAAYQVGYAYDPNAKAIVAWKKSFIKFVVQLHNPKKLDGLSLCHSALSKTNGVSFQERPVLIFLLSKSNEGESLRPVLHDSVK